MSLRAKSDGSITIKVIHCCRRMNKTAYRLYRWYGNFISIDSLANRLKSILILTSNDNIAPGVVNETDKWDMQNYRESPYTMNISVAITDGRPVRLRHIAVYNNGSSGVSLTEFEAFGIGMYLNRTLHQKFGVCIIMRQVI